LGTIRSLFLNVNSDPSTQGRKNDYGPVLEYFQQNPLSGRGIGTFVPEIYRTLDNQYLGLLVETGLLGTLAFLTLLLGAIVTAVMVRRASTDARTRDLAQCLIAGIVVIGVNSATFDTFGFAMCTGTLTLMIGLIGWLWADQRRSQGAPTFEPERRSTSRPLVVITVSALLVSWVVGGVAVVQSKTKTEWRSIASLVPVTGQTSGTGAYFATPRASLTVSLLHDTLDDRAVRDKVEKLATGNYEVAVGDGSLAMGTDRIGYGPILWISAEARTPDESHALLEIVADEADRRLLQWQTSQGTLPELITTQRNVEAPYPVAGRRSRALGGFAMLSFILVAMGLTLRRERRLRVRAPGVGPAALEAVSS
jgi:hypothetical protein